MNRVARFLARDGGIVASVTRGGETFVFRFAPGRSGRTALYDALDDHLRRGILTDQDVRALLLGLDQQPCTPHRRQK